MTQRFDVAIAGELNLDLILYGLPEDLPTERETISSGFALTLGSSSAILAHNLALLGSRVVFSSLVGRDAMGVLCRELLQAAGVDTNSVKMTETGTGTGVTIILPLADTRRILTYPGAIFEMSYADLDLDALSAARHFHLSSFFLHRGLLPDLPRLFRQMKESGLSTSLDTNDDPDDRWENLDSVLPWVDTLFCNERELGRIADEADVDRAAELTSQKVPLLVVKRGPNGASAFTGGTRTDEPAIAVTVVDTIGAGDSFDAGFLHRQLQGGNLASCLAAGNAAGALSATRAGGVEAFRQRTYAREFLAAYGLGDEYLDSLSANLL